MKKIDRLLLVSFIPPFLVTFGIATFVLLMQILWVYIDDIAGKGLGIFVIIELLAYKCVGLVPMALPLAILISGVMVMGGLAERYELSSLKSAGISLIRTMRPIIIFGSVAMIVSYLCNDYIIPVANLQFGSRMYDIREKKPALSLESGIFNDDFGNYAIRIGDKDSDGRGIQDILMYDHSNANTGRLTQVVAESGEMYATPDGNYFIMQLYDGHQYIESAPAGRSTSAGSPFIRTSFKSWNKVFDLSEFNLDVTNPELFSQNRSMMSISQLANQIDTIQTRIDQRRLNLAKQVGAFFSVIPVDSLYPDGVIDRLAASEEEAKKLNTQRDSTQNAQETLRDSIRQDSIQQSRDSIKQELTLKEKQIQAQAPVHSQAQLPTPKAVYSDSLDAVMKRSRRVASTQRQRNLATEARRQAQRDSTKTQPLVPIERYADTMQSITEWLKVLTPAERRRFVSKAKASARAIVNQAGQAEISLNRTMEDKVKHIYEMHTKYSMAVVCIIFVFVGAPLGAIVRKGGFGYPLLVSVVAFIVFIVLTIFCRKIAETFLVPAALAAWLPCIVLFPIGLWLTVKAMADSKLFDMDGLKRILDNMVSRIPAYTFLSKKEKAQLDEAGK
ncbi:MAG: LptF/LptG family permease [Bacteroidota bacterium]